MKLALRETLTGFRRAPLLSVLSITTIAFSLFAFGLFGLVVVNLRGVLQQVEDRVELRAFVAEGTPVEATAALQGDVASFPEVAHVDMVTPDSALARAKRELPEFSDVFDADVLPASIEVRLKPGFRDPTTVKAVAARLQTYQFIDNVGYGEEWVQKLYRLRNIATVAAIGLSLAFATVAVIVISATIRMAVLARGREISIMRLVGATDMFVRAPFLIEGFIKGVLGGTLALVLLYLANSAIDRWVFHTTFFDPGLAWLGVIGGALIGLAGSAFSVGRQLKRV